MTKITTPETGEPFGIPVRPDDLPDELKIFPQWVLWKARPRAGQPGQPGKFDKIPYQPNGRHASSTDETTWSDFDTVVATYEAGGYNGIGFVLTADDIFVGVDLDDCADPLTGELTSEAQQIVAELDTYTELSPSGAGIRCLLVGKVPGACKAASIEIYGEGRFLTMTGCRWNAQSVENRNEAINRLWARFKGAVGMTTGAATGSTTSTTTGTTTNDTPINIDQGESLAEADAAALLEDLKSDTALDRLIGGDLSDYGDDHSAADFGLLSEILKHTGGDPVKARQVFEMTSLSWRTKWKSRADYRKRTLTAALAHYRETRGIDSFEALPPAPAFVESITASRSGNAADTAPDAAASAASAFPEALIDMPGLVGSVIRSMRANAHKDQPALAVASSLTAVSFLSRNAYTVAPWNTPLGLYFLILAETGQGKEDGRSWIRQALSRLNCQNLAPEAVSSGPAILRHLQERQHLLVMQDEMGKLLRQASANPGSHIHDYIAELMRLYGLGSKVHGGKIYAKKVERIEPIQFPYVVLHGVTTATSLMSALTSDDVDSGFLNRMLLIDIGNRRPPLCDEPKHGIPPLIRDQLEYLTRNPLAADLGARWTVNLGDTPEEDLGEAGKGVQIFPDAGARELLRQYRHTTDTRLGDKPHGAMWARAAQNAIAVAGVIALGVWAERNHQSKDYPDHPVIEKHHAELAIALVDWSVGRWLAKLNGELSNTPFEALRKKALKYIAEAREYTSDKRFGRHCARGLMPRGKLTKLMGEEPRAIDSLVKSLLDSEQIVEVVETHGRNKVRLYHATQG